MGLDGGHRISTRMSKNPAKYCSACGRSWTREDIDLCPECGSAVGPRPKRRLPSFLSLPQMRYQNAYVWLVFVSALDIILTWLVLYVWQGHEVNPMASAIIETWGFGWAILFKFGMMLFAVIACEVIGRRNDRAGRRLAIAAVIINAIPVAYTFALLFFAGPPNKPHGPT